ncbi:MAG: hypothetical protein C4523_15905, partial [Myxococcales bacterium]
EPAAKPAAKPVAKTTEPLSARKTSISTGDYKAAAGMGAGKVVGIGVVLVVLALAGAYLLWPSNGKEGKDVASTTPSTPAAQLPAPTPPTGAQTPAVPPAANTAQPAVGTDGDADAVPSPAVAAADGDAETTGGEAETEPKPSGSKKTAAVSEKKNEKLTPAEKQKRSLEYYEKGNAAFNKKKWKEAISNYKLARRYNDKSPMIYKKLGLSYYNLGKKTEAKSYLGRYLKMAPKDKEAARIREIYKDL